jgi:tRNA(Ile)-lysidine synthase
MRSLIKGLRSAELALPVNSHILIACSGGADSIALAHAMTHYGRRGGRRSLISLLHVNHGWRREASDADEAFVEALGVKWGVPVVVRRLKAPEGVGDSWEDLARKARKTIYAEETEKRPGAILLTAHHADDQAETLLWRIFTGAASTHGAGVVARIGNEVRPLLGVRKHQLLAYLAEEKQEWREDATNVEGRFLRSKMRLELMPVIERLFPRAIEHLVQSAAKAEKVTHSLREPSEGLSLLEAILGMEGIRLRRPHWEAILQQASEERCGASQFEVHLPKGWKIRHDPHSKPRRWVIESD